MSRALHSQRGADLGAHEPRPAIVPDLSFLAGKPGVKLALATPTDLVSSAILLSGTIRVKQFEKIFFGLAPGSHTRAVFRHRDQGLARHLAPHPHKVDGGGPATSPSTLRGWNAKMDS